MYVIVDIRLALRRLISRERGSGNSTGNLCTVGFKFSQYKAELKMGSFLSGAGMKLVCGLSSRGRRGGFFEKGGVQRGGYVVRLSLFLDSSDQKFVTESLRMGLAAQKGEDSDDLGVSVNDDLISRSDGGDNYTVKFGAVMIHS